MVALHVVSGKGGTGKTTVAAALALALAEEGRRTLLVEVEGRQGIAHLFDTAPLPYDEVRVAPAPGGGDVFGLAIEPEAALYEYLDIYYRLGPAGRALRKFGAIDFAATVAPGLRDVLLLGKVYESVGTRRGDRREYDAVVLDAPPTGRIKPFLDVGGQVSGLAKVGPIKAHADAMNTLIHSSHTVVHLVTWLEAMPVQETLDAIDELTDSGIAVGSVIINGTVGHDLSAASLAHLDAPPMDALAAVLKRAGAARPVSTAKALIEDSRDRGIRRDLEIDLRERLTALPCALIDLPELDPIDVSALYTLAEPLAHACATEGWR